MSESSVPVVVKPSKDVELTSKRIDEKLMTAAELAVDILNNEQTASPDPRIRIQAANSILEKAGKGGKDKGGSTTIVQINLDKIASGLKEMRKVGFGDKRE